MKIILEIPDSAVVEVEGEAVAGLNPYEDLSHQSHRIDQLLRDAFGEFCAVRTPIRKYVGKRYESLGDSDKLEKEIEVRSRIALARQLHRAAVIIQREELVVCPVCSGMEICSTADGEDYTCRNCNGHGRVPRPAKPEPIEIENPDEWQVDAMMAERAGRDQGE